MNSTAHKITHSEGHCAKKLSHFGNTQEHMHPIGSQAKLRRQMSNAVTFIAIYESDEKTININTPANIARYLYFN